MADPPTGLSLPSSLSYPITITRICVEAYTTVQRGAILLEYSFTSDSSRKALALLAQGAIREVEDGVTENDMVGTWESGIEGEVVSWSDWVKAGAKIDRKYHAEAIQIQQACTHPVQLHGMCGICGADLTTDDYLTRPAEDAQAGPSRNGGHEMSHDALGVTVTTNEAKRLEHQAKDTLLSSRKLTLIVDLDQTIIHTTVDPTVGEWMAEMEDDEEVPVDDGGFSPIKGEEDGQEADTEAITTTPPGSPKKVQKVQKEKNPNAEALRDVARFQLADDLPPGYVPPKKGKGRGESIHDRWYYTKPRPGLPKFLDEMNQKYEMHVYTMGTRSYADAICNVIDPEGKIFGGRILSRDESGSFSSKNLKRLFPTDQSMVVVIDDRADVWGDIPNLVKVVPYEFFLGIGDINSSFLPPAPVTPTSSPPRSEVSSEDSPPPVTPPAIESKEGLLAQAKLLDELSEQRPLAKLQEEMEKEEAAKEQVQVAANGTEAQVPAEGNVQEEGTHATDSGGAQTNGGVSTASPSFLPRPRKPLLDPHDFELNRLADILSNIHGDFYYAYDARPKPSSNDELPMGCDVELIIPELKSRVLAGCTIVFSGVIPRHQSPENSEIFQQAETYGAKPTTEVSRHTTHCVIAAVGTEKMYRAKKLGAKVVWLEWFTRSVALWTRLDEREFEVNWEGAPMPGPTGSGSITPKLVEQSDHTPATSIGAASDETQQEEELVEDEDGDGDGDGDVDNVELQGRGWDDDVQAELDAFLDDSSDIGDTELDADSVKSVPHTPSSAPGTPRKRVRYADEESLPLESFKDPLPVDPSESPPKKRPRPLLLEAPTGEHVPNANKYQWKGKMREMQPSDVDREDGDEGDHASVTGVSEVESEDDLFAQMLKDSLDDEDEGGEEQ